VLNDYILYDDGWAKVGGPIDWSGNSAEFGASGLCATGHGYGIVKMLCK